MHAFIVVGGQQGDYHYVVNGTFTVTVNYSDEFDFVAFNASPNGMGQILLNWENNNTPGNVLLATNSSDSFVDPVNGSSYTAGDILGSAEILYFGDAEVFNHTGLESMTKYFYKAWACDGSNNYTSGLTDNIVLGSQLYGNYPNPFNPETSISYSVFQPQHVKLEVYNMKGQLVKTLLNKQVETANTKLNVVWNGRDNNNNQVSSGIYLYKLVTDNYTKTNKMILMK